MWIGDGTDSMYLGRKWPHGRRGDARPHAGPTAHPSCDPSAGPPPMTLHTQSQVTMLRSLHSPDTVEFRSEFARSERRISTARGSDRTLRVPVVP